MRQRNEKGNEKDETEDLSKFVIFKNKSAILENVEYHTKILLQ